MEGGCLSSQGSMRGEVAQAGGDSDLTILSRVSQASPHLQFTLASSNIEWSKGLVYLQIINIAFLPHILLLFLPIAILPEYNRAKCGLRNDIKIKRSEELKRKGIHRQKKKRRKKRKRKESMTREEFTMSACVCAKKAIKPPISPTHPCS
jgi:hypothetical protein